jgi:hypothetical protein
MGEVLEEANIGQVGGSMMMMEMMMMTIMMISADQVDDRTVMTEEHSLRCGLQLSLLLIVILEPTGVNLR